MKSLNRHTMTLRRGGFGFLRPYTGGLFFVSAMALCFAPPISLVNQIEYQAAGNLAGGHLVSEGKMGKYFHVVTVNGDDCEHIRHVDSIQDVIKEFVHDDESCHWMSDSLQISSDEQFAYCQAEDDYNERMFIREICDAEAQMLIGEWEFLEEMDES